MKIYDCFTFFNEFEILDIRLAELYDVVGKFIISEATLTFTGLPKPLYLRDNFSRYEKYKDKIEIVTLEKYHSDTMTAWEREFQQRRILAEPLRQCLKNDDLVMISDVDEIPRRAAVNSLRQGQQFPIPSVLAYSMYYGKLNYQIISPEHHKHWLGGCIVNKKFLDETNWDFQLVRGKRWEHPYPRLMNFGWHFSFLGDAKAIKNKLISYAHTENAVIDEKTIQERLDKCKDLIGREGFELECVPVDSSFPECVVKNLDKYRHLMGEKNIPPYSIVICTYDKRFKQYFIPLITAIRKYKPDTEIVVCVNSNYKEKMDKAYRKNMLAFLYGFDNIYPIFLTQFRGCAKMWNLGLMNSSNNGVLSLNDDVGVSENFFAELDDYLSKNGADESFKINNHWSHVFLSKKEVCKAGWFDERFLGMGWEDDNFNDKYKMALGRPLKSVKINGLINYLESEDTVLNQVRHPAPNHKNRSIFNENFGLAHPSNIPENHINSMPTEEFFLTHYDEL